MNARIEHIHEVRCRRSGHYLIIDLKLDMNPAMTVKKSPAVSIEVKQVQFERFPISGMSWYISILMKRNMRIQ